MPLKHPNGLSGCFLMAQPVSVLILQQLFKFFFETICKSNGTCKTSFAKWIISLKSGSIG